MLIYNDGKNSSNVVRKCSSIIDKISKKSYKKGRQRKPVSYSSKSKHRVGSRKNPKATVKITKRNTVLKEKSKSNRWVGSEKNREATSKITKKNTKFLEELGLKTKPNQH